jgi:hypothetical protein
VGQLQACNAAKMKSSAKVLASSNFFFSGARKMRQAHTTNGFLWLILLAIGVMQMVDISQPRCHNRAIFTTEKSLESSSTC